MTTQINVTLSAISIDTVSIVTQSSKRTWQRRLANGNIKKQPDDARGRAMVNLIDVKPLICIQMNDEDISMLLKADQGDSISQNDIGQKFFIAEKYEISVYWFNQAANRENADAMHWLGICYAAGKGIEKNENLALMWIAKSASLGHPISTKQMKNLTGKIDNKQISS